MLKSVPARFGRLLICSSAMTFFVGMVDVSATGVRLQVPDAAARPMNRSVHVNSHAHRHVNHHVNQHVHHHRPVTRPVGRTVVVAPVRAVPVTRPWYWGRVVAGVTIGAMITVAVANTVPVPPSSQVCWYWADSTRMRGYWDYCVAPSL